jgi:hypothetical protein
MATVRRTGRSRAESTKQAKAGAKTQEAGDIATLERETERLKEELASEKQRSAGLEAASTQVAARLDAAIASIKAFLERQG